MINNLKSATTINNNVEKVYPDQAPRLVKEMCVLIESVIQFCQRKWDSMNGIYGDKSASFKTDGESRNLFAQGSGSLHTAGPRSRERGVRAGTWNKSRSKLEDRVENARRETAKGSSNISFEQIRGLFVQYSRARKKLSVRR